ncbi:MAG: hypothetical protein Tsb0020_38540 [Haliangiales bacterium]
MTPALVAIGRARLAEARALLAAACPHDPAADVADETLFGPALGYESAQVHALGVERGGQIAGLVVYCGAWLRLLAVAPQQRNQGLGGALLEAAEAAIASAGADAVRVLDQPGNYLAPGVDVRNHAAIDWLTKRGYRRRGERVNLIVDVMQNPFVSPGHRAALCAGIAGYELRRARNSDAGALARVITEAFSAGWAFEVKRALEGTPAGVHIAIECRSGQLAGFAAHDGNNRGRGWFGPAGTLPEHRGRGLGRALLCACLVDIAEAGHERCEVAWIGPRDFYQRTAGVSGERRFAVLRKDLS